MKSTKYALSEQF